MKRATWHLILACGALVALGGAICTQSQQPESPPSFQRRSEARERLNLPSREIERLTGRATSNPEAACNEAALGHPDELAAMLSRWAESDLVAVERWAWAQSGRLRQTALGILAVEAARNDLEAAGRIAASMEEGGERSDALSFVAAQWAAEDADGAVQWLREMPAGEMRSDSERRVIPAIASDHPEVAAEYTATEMPDPALQRTVAPEIVGRWAQVDPVAAGKWIGRVESPDMREPCLRSLIGVWNTRDSIAVQGWIDSLPESDFRHQARGIFSNLSP